MGEGYFENLNTPSAIFKTSEIIEGSKRFLSTILVWIIVKIGVKALANGESFTSTGDKLCSRVMVAYIVQGPCKMYAIHYWIISRKNNDILFDFLFDDMRVKTVSYLTRFVSHRKDIISSLRIMICH